MKKCPYCGHENENNAERCGHCFAVFPAVKQEEQTKKSAKKSKGDE